MSQSTQCLGSVVPFGMFLSLMKRMDSNVHMEPFLNADEKLKSSKVSTWHQ